MSGGMALAIRGNSAASRNPPAPRIVAVADAFDAMSNDRPYRKSMSNEGWIRFSATGPAAQWDPQVIDAFFRCRDRIRAGIRG